MNSVAPSIEVVDKPRKVDDSKEIKVEDGISEELAKTLIESKDKMIQQLVGIMRLLFLYPDTSSSLPTKIIAFGLLALSWLNAVRMFSISVTESTENFADVVAGIAYVIFYLCCAITRSVVVAGSWTGTWQAVLAWVATPPIYSALPIMSNGKAIGRYTRLRLVIFGNSLFYATLVLVHTFLMIFATIFFPHICRWFITPFEIDSNLCVVAIFIGILHAISEIGLLFGVHFIVVLTWAFCGRFGRFGEFLKLYKVSKASGKDRPFIDLEGIRSFYVESVEMVQTFDQHCRWSLSCVLSCGFIGFLVNVFNVAGLGEFQAATSSYDRAMATTINAFQTLLSFILLLQPIVPSALLSYRAEAVRKTAIDLPGSVYAHLLLNDKSSADALSSAVTVQAQLTLFVWQLSQPVALTFLGLIHLRQKTIVALCAALLTYFLILIEYSHLEVLANFATGESLSNKTHAD